MQLDRGHIEIVQSLLTAGAAKDQADEREVSVRGCLVVTPPCPLSRGRPVITRPWPLSPSCSGKLSERKLAIAAAVEGCKAGRAAEAARPSAAAAAAAEGCKAA